MVGLDKDSAGREGRKVVKDSAGLFYMGKVKGPLSSTELKYLYLWPSASLLSRSPKS